MIDSVTHDQQVLCQNCRGEACAVTLLNGPDWMNLIDSLSNRPLSFQTLSLGPLPDG